MTERDREILRSLLRERMAPEPRSGPGRLPTDEELVRAAWADLAIEEPDLKLEDARRVILGRS